MLMRTFSITLLLPFVASQCQDGFTRLQSNPAKCYKYTQSPIIPNDGTCDPTYLIAIETQKENDELLGIVSKNGLTWFGLLQDAFTGVLSWHNGAPLNYTNLAEGTGSYYYLQPDGTWRNCLSNYSQVSGYLCGAGYGAKPSCPTHGCPTQDNPNMTLIQSSVHSCNCYYFFNDKIINFDDSANIKCKINLQQQNGSMLSIDSAFADNELTTLSRQLESKNGCKTYYNGLDVFDNVFKGGWVNGDNSTYRNWRQGSPDLLGDSGAVLNLDDGTWTNPENPPSDGYCYICEYVLPMRIA